jgi:molybdate transport system substrate-binding protein
MQPISLYSGLAVQGVLEREVLPAFHANHDAAVTTTFEPTKVLSALIDAGARPNLILGVADTLRQLADSGVLAQSSLTPLVRSGIGVAVAPGQPTPKIGTVAHLTAAIRSARSVAYSRTGASGAHFAGLLDRLGIAEEVNARACILEKGFTAEALLDGRADLAVQQVIELAAVPGVTIVGPLPAGAQHYVELWVGAATSAPPAALQLLQFLSSPTALRAYSESGLEVIRDADHPSTAEQEQS